MMTNEHTTWIEVNLSALRANFIQVRKAVDPSVKVMAVVKADAYGHGAGAAQAFALADYLGVTTLEEGLAISGRVLVFSPLLPEQAEAALEREMELTVCDPDSASAASAAAVRLGKTARVHVKVDTGMGRLGVPVADAVHFMGELVRMPNLTIAGVYTHFASAGAKSPAHAKKQNAAFAALADALRREGLPTGLLHAANSAALLNLPDSHYEMVRPGTLLYGQHPSPHGPRLDLAETWCMKTRIVALRRLPAGVKIGYGSEFTTRRPSTLAVIPVGYSDGFTLMPASLARGIRTLLRREPQVTVRGKRAPVVGRVSMQMCSVDVTDVPGACVGDEVVVPARRTTASSRIPRVYI
ncbi:MAG: alanine racemase [Armatimonadota bacterium]